MNETKTLDKIVVYTVASWDHPLVVLRIYDPATLAGIRVIRGNEGETVNLDLISDADLVIIHRDYPRFWKEYQSVISRARAESKPVLYEIDDLLFEMPEDHSHREDYIAGLLAMLYAIIEADTVTCSSKPLQEYLSEINPNTRLLNNYLNDQLWKFKDPRRIRQRNQPIVIGYMGGETHQFDLQLISKALLKIIDKYSGSVILRIWGGKPPEELLSSPHSEWIPIYEENYGKFVQLFSQQEFDICIAPLRDNLFNRAKSPLKFLEYSALGVPGVYSQIPPYEIVVQHGINGFLASNDNDWEYYLTKLIENEDLRFQIADQAQKTVIDNWLLSNHCDEWLETYRGVEPRPQNQYKAVSNQNNLLKVISQAQDYQADLESSLNDTSYRLNDILESRSWRLLQKVQQLRLRIIPRGSIPERLLFNQGLRKDKP